MNKELKFIVICNNHVLDHRMHDNLEAAMDTISHHGSLYNSCKLKLYRAVLDATYKNNKEQ